MHEPSAAAKAYESYIGRWSRIVAKEFLAWLDVPTRASWFDVACGTGALTSTVLSMCDPEYIDASDPNDERIAFARQTITDRRVTFAVGEGTHIAAPDGRYDAVIGGLAFPAICDTTKALAEFARITKPGGTVAGYVWDFDGEMQLLRYFWNAAEDLEPGTEENDEQRFAICHPDRLGAVWRDAGFDNVAVRAIDGQARFADFYDFWTPFLSGNSPAQTLVQSLDEFRRARLRERLRGTLPIASDDSITLITRAWSVKGTA